MTPLSTDIQHGHDIPPIGAKRGAVIIVAVLAALVFLGRLNYLLFHTLTEFFTAVVACSIFVVAWNCRRFQTNGFLFLLGCISLSAAIVDLFHAMAFKGMGVFAAGGAPLATQLWIAGRYLQTGAFIVAPLCVRRTIPPRLTLISSIILTFIVLAVIFAGGIFPECYVEGVGVTPFKKASEFLFVFAYLVTLALLHRERYAFDPGVLRLLRMSIVAFALCELAFSSYTDVSGYANLAGHLLKILGYYFLYRGVIEIGLTKPYDLLFRELKLKEEVIVAERNELWESRELLREIVEGTSDAIYVKDLHGRYQLINGAALRFVGKPVEAVLGRDDTVIFPPDEARVVMESDRSVITSGRAQTLNEVVTTAGGKQRAFLTTKGPLFDKKGNVTGLFGMARDITDLKRIHEEIELLNTDLSARAVELEVLNSDLEAFNSSVSHDLRGPITNICGQCQVILELFPDKADPQVLDFVRGILDESWRMNDLINTLLDFSRLGRVEMNCESVELSSLALEIAALLAAHSPGRNVRFSADKGLVATGDPGLLRIVMENLLGNAWKYTGKTADASIRFGMLEKDGRRTFYVRDNGAGFDMAKSGDLFAPFKRLHVASEFEGVGIGLATVHRIITRHGGTIWAEGVVGQGATFYFTL